MRKRIDFAFDVVVIVLRYGGERGWGMLMRTVDEEGKKERPVDTFTYAKVLGTNLTTSADGDNLKEYEPPSHTGYSCIASSPGNWADSFSRDL